MAVYNKDQKLLFICEPHTASRSISDYLLKIQGSIGIHPHHATVSDILNKGLLSQERVFTAKRFSVVRNVFDLLVTHWIYNREKHETFHDWLRNRAHGLQQRVAGANTLFWRSANVHVRINYEQLVDGLGQILGQEVKLPKIGVTKDKQRWQSYYTQEDFEYVQKTFPDAKRYSHDVSWLAI